MSNLNQSTGNLTVQNIQKNYGKKTALKDVCIELKNGEIVGLFGPNGSGKTTCFSIIIGLIKTDAGKLYLNSQDITNYPIHLRAKMGLSYLPQESSVFKGLSVFDNLKLVLEIIYNDRELINQNAEDLMKEFGIIHLKDLPSAALSGGERRRLEIARTLAIKPKFIMLDEPLAGIDPIAVNDIKNLILHLKERGIGVLITDHNVRDTLDIIDRAYVIYEGKVLIHGSSEELVNSQLVRDVYFGTIFDK